MRIIITENGQRIIRKLSSNRSAPNIFNNPNRSQELIIQENPLMKNNYSTNTKNILPNKSINSSYIYSSNNSININILKPQVIRLKKKKLRLPIYFLKKYEKNYEENNIIVQPIKILSNLESKNNSLIENNSKIEIKSKFKTFDESKNNSNSNSHLLSNVSSSVFLPRVKSHYSVREILPQKCLDNFDNKLKQKIDSLKHDIPYNNKILRQDWSNRDIFDELDKKKNKEINSRNYKLIEYLMGKNTISKVFLEKINERDEKKFYLFDKLSGKALEEKEKQKLFDKEIRQRIDDKLIKENFEIRKILLKIKNNVKENIKDDHMNKYILVKDSNKGVYRNLFKKFRKKYWKKSDNFSRYFHKSQNVHYEEI